jgi:hypothetical protein
VSFFLFIIYPVSTLMLVPAAATVASLPHCVKMVGGSIHTFAAQLDISGAAEYDRWLIDHEMAVSFPYSISCWEYSRDGRLNGVPGDALLYARIQLRE